VDLSIPHIIVTHSKDKCIKDMTLWHITLYCYIYCDLLKYSQFTINDRGMVYGGHKQRNAFLIEMIFKKHLFFLI